MQAEHMFKAWSLDIQPVWMSVGLHCGKIIALSVVVFISVWWRAWCYKRYGVLCSSNLGSSHLVWPKVARLQMCSHGRDDGRKSWELCPPICILTWFTCSMWLTCCLRIKERKSHPEIWPLGEHLWMGCVTCRDIVSDNRALQRALSCEEEETVLFRASLRLHSHGWRMGCVWGSSERWSWKGSPGQAKRFGIEHIGNGTEECFWATIKLVN